VDQAKLFLGWAQRKRRALCAARRIAVERNPGGILRLAREVRSLTEAARRVCPQERALQSRLSALHEDMRRLTVLAGTPEFRCLTAEKRLLLHRGLVESREKLLRVMGKVESPTDILQ
jgi:hypothetical protein